MAIDLRGGSSVLFYNTFSAFPATGSSTTLYVDRGDMVVYIWNGTSYDQLGGESSITTVDNYAALLAIGAPNVPNMFYWCSSSQGTSWLPGPLGGTYYNSGLYYSNGTTWEYMNSPYQATQAEVNAGIVGDKFVTPSTLYNSTQWSANPIIIDTTPIASGVAGRILFEGSGNVIQEDAGLFWDNGQGLLMLPSATNALITDELTGKVIVTKEWTEDRFKTTTLSSSTYFQNITLAPTTIDGMIITPPSAGTYKVDFNTQFNTALANITQQAVVDLNALYLNLNGQAVTNPVFPPFTAGTTILPGVYETAGAVGPVGSITLNGQGNPNAIFIFRTIAALTFGAGCVLNLTNGASSNNVFFIAGGAISLGAGSNVSGTFISPLAAVGVGAGAFLNGRVFSQAAAITNNGNITVPLGISQFNMGITPNFAIFTSVGAVSNVGANIIIGDIGTNNGTITGFETATLSGNIYLPAQGASICLFSIYVNGTIVPTSTRERTNVISKDDVILSDVVTITAGQIISIKSTNSIGISRFYNRNLTVTKI